MRTPPIRPLAALLLAAACMRVRYPAAGGATVPGAGEVLVCGSLRVVCDGRNVAPGLPVPDPVFLPVDPDVRLSLFHVEPNRRQIYVRIEPDGRFYWIVPRGTYLLYISRGGAVIVNEPVAAFQVPAGGEIAYIGELTLDTETTRETRHDPMDYELVDIRIGDEYEAAEAALRARHPTLTDPPARRLMIEDPELPGLFRNYTRRRCARILERRGLRLPD